MRTTCLDRGCPMIAALPDLDTEKCPGCDLNNRDAFWIHHDANSASWQEPQTYISKFISVIFPRDITGHTCPLRRKFVFCAFIHSSLTWHLRPCSILRQVEACQGTPQGQESRVTKDIHSSTHPSAAVCLQGPGPAFILSYLYHTARENWEIHRPALREHCPASSFINTNDNFFIGLSSVMILWNW